MFTWPNTTKTISIEPERTPVTTNSLRRGSSRTTSWLMERDTSESSPSLPRGPLSIEKDSLLPRRSTLLTSTSEALDIDAEDKLEEELSEEEESQEESFLEEEELPRRPPPREEKSSEEEE